MEHEHIELIENTSNACVHNTYKYIMCAYTPYETSSMNKIMPPESRLKVVNG